METREERAVGSSENSLSVEVVVAGDLGLHARPAAEISKLASKSRSGVWIAKGAERVDATSIIDILSLACAKGTRLVISVADPADRPLLQSVAALIES